ncbi:glycosyltransferase family 2 protein [Undibacterium squillarum]|uniref:glycosyltransferase family 2 protein n=1 Tax=Undibacterium squillarum TaxID=1131567 RepID=UPI0035B0E498
MSAALLKKTPAISVVIVNFNGGQLVLDCLAKLREQTLRPLEIILVDNASQDGSGQRAETEFPEVNVIHAGANLGFAKGNNLAVQKMHPDSEWIALLNPDAFPDPDWLLQLALAAENHPEFAIFGSRLMDANREQMLDGVGDAYHLSGLVWREGHGQAVTPAHLQQKEIFSCCAAAGLYRRDVFDQLGGFDEDYFCYVEDIDLGFRYLLAGYRCLYVPGSVARHVGSAITGRRSDFSVYHGHRNLVWTYVKNMPGPLFWLCLPLHLMLNLVEVLHFARHGQFQVIKRSKLDAIRQLPHFWKKRQQIQANRRVSIATVWGLLNKNLTGKRN